MPTYEYRCRDCQEPLEIVQSIHDAPLTQCPSCGGTLRKVFGNVGVVFKGSGFYRTDNRGKSKTKSDADSGKSDAGKSESGKSDSGKSDAGKSDAGKSESGKSQASSGLNGSSTKSAGDSSGSKKTSSSGGAGVPSKAGAS